jgi:hypothetical protein
MPFTREVTSFANDDLHWANAPDISQDTFALGHSFPCAKLDKKRH